MSTKFLQGKDKNMSRTVIEDLQSQLRDEELNYLGAMADLDDVVETVIRYLNGESSKERLESYIRLNYPKQSKKLK